MAEVDDRRGSSFYDAELLDAYLAHRYAPVTSPNLVMEEPAFLRAAGDLAGLRILDLGCGDGTFGRTCSDQGCADYLGVDGSVSMIDRAIARRLPSNVDFRHADIEDFEPEEGAHDLVTARMVLHYVRDLRAAIGRIRAALDVGGRMVFSVVHPVVTAGNAEPDGPRRSQLVEGYFEQGPRRRQWFGRSVTWHHRTIEHYLDAVCSAGLVIDRLSECQPDEARFAGDRAEYERRRQVPLFLLIGARVPQPGR